MSRRTSAWAVVASLVLLASTASSASPIQTRVCVTNNMFLKGDQNSLNVILVDQTTGKVVTGGKEVRGYDDSLNCQKAVFPGTTCLFEPKNHACFTPPGEPPECGPGHAFAFGTDSFTINGPSGDNPIVCDHGYDAQETPNGAGLITGTLRVTVGDPPDGDGTNEHKGAHCTWKISPETDC